MLTNVEEQEKLAEELHAKVYGNPENQPAATPAPAETTAVAEEPKPVEPAPEGPTKALKAKDPEKENDPAYWKRRAELLAGKIDAEVPRFAEENRKLRERLAELEKAAPAETTAVAPVAAPVVPEELREKYGEEFLSDMAKLMPHQAAPQTNAELESVKAELAELKQKAAEISFNEFKANLTQIAPQWQTLNTDDEFNDWLDGVDPLSGAQRRNLFNDAVARGDTQRAAQFFNSFGGNQSSVGEQAPKVPPAEHFMAPNHSKANQPPPTKKQWTAAEVEAFYIDVRKGRVNDADAARIEQDIFLAQREGRLRG